MFNERVCAVLDYTNLVLLDIKALRPNFAGKSAEVTDGMTRALLDELEKRGTEVWIRHVVVPGLTDDDTLLDELVEFVRHYKVVRKIEWLPYHTMGVFKYEELGLDYPLADVPPLARERVEAIKARYKASS